MVRIVLIVVALLVISIAVDAGCGSGRRGLLRRGIERRQLRREVRVESRAVRRSAILLVPSQPAKKSPYLW